MKVKFKSSERIAGAFIVVALVGAVSLSLMTAIQKGWLQSKVMFKTKVQSADGLREGASVTISGIRAGEISDIELESADNIIVHFYLFEEFHKQVKTDSVLLVSRPFVLGDKEIEVTVGSEGAEMLSANSFIDAQTSFDMMDLLSGKRLGPFLGTIEGLLNNMSVLAKAFADPKRTEAFVKMFDRMDPLMLSLGKMSTEVAKLSRELNEVIPQMRKESPELGQQMAQLIGQMNALTNAVTPAFKEVGPDLPRVSRRAVEALDEMVVTLKAMQKSFLLSGNVKEVKKEESSRKPASE